METFPSLAKEWHPEKNNGLKPGDVKPDSSLQVWWRCNLKHEWTAAVIDRVNGAICPTCPPVTNPFPKMVSLAEAQPEAVKYWHPTKNGDRTLDKFSNQSGYKVWWQCQKGHQWFDTIQSMRFKPRCRQCYPGTRTTQHYNLAVIRPVLMRQWHPTKNGDLSPTDVSPYSGKKLWWMCGKGHEFIEMPANLRSETSCPVCSLEIRNRPFNLENYAPHLIPFWHPSKNSPHNPEALTPGSHRRYWWICEKGHDWKRGIGNMKRNQKCPVCRKIYLEETNTLLLKNPELAKEWHPTKNGSLTPDKVKPHTLQKVWWLCPKGHEYEASLGNRNRTGGKGRGCPYCSGRKDLRKENLAILLPELAKEWDPEKNGDLTPGDVSIVSSRSVWWRCKKGHQWQRSIIKRINGIKAATRNCPICEEAMQSLAPVISDSKL